MRRVEAGPAGRLGSLVGQQLGNWYLERCLGVGGMGEVYLGEHESLGTRMAVKVLAAKLAGDASARERFFQEARVQARIRHPGIVQVADFSHARNLPYSVSEYMAGGSLEDLLESRSGPVEPVRAIAWTLPVLDALDHAHQQGVIHRDVKPSNILLDGVGGAKVTDFGIAFFLGGERLTRAGVALGTPQYMSPEQVRTPQEIDHRADVYSMGIVLYELLTGRVPFDSETGSEYEVQSAQVHLPPPPLREVCPEVPEELEGIVLKSLEKVPSARYRGCGELAGELLRFLSRKSTNPPLLVPSPSKAVLPAAIETGGESDAGPGEPPTPPAEGRLRAWRAAALFSMVIVALLSAWVVLLLLALR